MTVLVQRILKRNSLRLLAFLLAFFFSGLSAKSATYTYITGTYSTYPNFLDGDIILISSGQTVTFNNFTYTGATLQVDGQLTISSSFQSNGNVNVGATGTLNIPNGFTKYGNGTPTNIQSGGVLNTGNFTNGMGGTINGTINVSGTLTFTSGLFTLDCPGKIVANNLTNYSGTPAFGGKGYVQVTGTFTSNNPLSNSANIVLNAPGAGPSVSGKNSGSATLGTASPCTALAANFESIVATMHNETLNVKWTTLSETNSDKFVVEISENGETFKPLGTVLSKSESGNSSSKLDYNFSYNFNTTEGKLLLGSIVLGLFLSSFSLFKKKRLTILPLLLVGIGCFGVFSCNKSDSGVELSSKKDLFVRIQQIEKDKTTTQYSKIVKVVLN